MDPRGLEKRVICNYAAGTEASVPDAVICINFLAALGDYRCETSSVSQFAYSGSNPGAQIVGVGEGGGVSSSRWYVFIKAPQLPNKPSICVDFVMVMTMMTTMLTARIITTKQPGRCPHCRPDHG
ncbi:hypothetical protein RB596_005562 [Gaeumannomyces avenae]